MEGWIPIWLAVITVLGGLLTAGTTAAGYVFKRAWDSHDAFIKDLTTKVEDCESERTEIDRKADELTLKNQSLEDRVSQCDEDRERLWKITESHREELNRVNKHLEFTDKRVVDVHKKIEGQ